MCWKFLDNPVYATTFLVSSVSYRLFATVRQRDVIGSDDDIAVRFYVLTVVGARILVKHSVLVAEASHLLREVMGKLLR